MPNKQYFKDENKIPNPLFSLMFLCELTIGREFDEGHRRVVIVNECLEALPRGRIPDAAEAVVTRGHDEAAIAIEMYRADGVRVCGEGLETLACT